MLDTNVRKATAALLFSGGLLLGPLTQLAHAQSDPSDQPSDPSDPGTTDGTDSTDLGGTDLDPQDLPSTDDGVLAATGGDSALLLLAGAGAAVGAVALRRVVRS